MSVFRGLHPLEAGRGGRGWHVEAESMSRGQVAATSIYFPFYLSEQITHAQKDRESEKY